MACGDRLKVSKLREGSEYGYDSCFKRFELPFGTEYHRPPCFYVSHVMCTGAVVLHAEVSEPRITDLSDDKCRGVPCQQSCDAAVGSCICHDGYRLVGTRCEGSQLFSLLRKRVVFG